MTKTIWVMFGSRTVEHDVSITWAYATMIVLERLWYNVVPIYIWQDGKRLVHNDFKDINNFKNLEKWDNLNTNIIPSKDNKLQLQTIKSGIFTTKKDLTIDIVFPFFHGKNWEDGSAQGLCELLKVPYVWPSMTSCGIWMDKDLMKSMFKEMWLPLVPYKVYTKNDLKPWTFQLADFATFNSTIWFPCFVKPVNLWSSIGVNKVKTPNGNPESYGKDLEEAIELAFHYDREIMIEKSVENLVELNCSVMEIDWQVVTSEVEQPVGSDSFLSFEEKYLSDWWTMQGFKDKVKIPAEIPEELSKQIKDWTKEVYVRFKCKWWAPMIDWMYDNVEKKLYINEINMIPWALQLHLRKASGYEPEVVIENLLKNAEKEFEEKEECSIDFKSNIVDYTADFRK